MTRKGRDMAAVSSKQRKRKTVVKRYQRPRRADTAPYKQIVPKEQKRHRECSEENLI